MGAVYEGVIVGKLNEWIAPQLFQPPNLRNHAINRFHFELRRNSDGGCTKFATPRTAALRLYSESRVAIGREQLESRHRRMRQVERFQSTIIKRIQVPHFQIADDPGPDRFAFSNHDGVGVSSRFLGQSGYVQAAKNDFCADRLKS